MKTLILTEKRTAGAELASCLDDKKLGSNLDSLLTKSKAGLLEGDNFVITWAAGHLFTQIKPNDIDPSYGLYQKLDNPEDYRLEGLVAGLRKIPDDQPHKIKQNKIIKSLLQSIDINKVIVACDSDAEGVAIGFDMVYENCSGFNKPILCFWNTGSFKSKEAVKKAMANLEPFDSPKYVALHHSQIARSTADWIVGMKVTKSAVDYYNKPFYIGRVKGSILSILGNRENEVKNFVPSNYWTLTANKGDLELPHFFMRESVEDGEIKNIKMRNYFDKDQADCVRSDVENTLYVKVEKFDTSSTTSKSRPLPLSGSDFASDMMGLYKIEYDECNEILDYLRQGGFTGYPGTNGRFFALCDSEDVKAALNTANNYFKLDTKFNPDTYLFNDKKAAKQNHSPLHLTSKIPTSNDISKWEGEALPRIKEGYELIAKRILVAFLENDEIEKQHLVVSSCDHNHKFELTGQKALKQGWRTFLNKEIKDTTFSSDEPLRVGVDVKLDSVSLKQSQTKVPPIHTVKTLLDTLMNVSRVIDKLIQEADDPKLAIKYKKIKKLLRNAEGIGTDRTRGSIINDLFENEIIQANKKKQLLLTPLGWELFSVCPSTLKSIILTANWENAFEEIRQGTRDYKEFIKEVDNHVMDEMIPNLINRVGVEVKPLISKRERLEGVECPLCASVIIETDKGYRCDNNRFNQGIQSGCKFSIIKDMTKTLGRVLSGVNDIEKLLNSKEDQSTLFKESRHGIFFDAANDFFVGVVWDEEVSKNELQETSKTYKLGDKYVLKEFRGRKLTKAQAENLLVGKSIKISRKSQAGKTYKVIATLQKEGGILDIEFA